jgi:hypothetical protein
VRTNTFPPAATNELHKPITPRIAAPLIPTHFLTHCGTPRNNDHPGLSCQEAGCTVMKTRRHDLETIPTHTRKPEQHTSKHNTVPRFRDAAMAHSINTSHIRMPISPEPKQARQGRDLSPTMSSRTSSSSLCSLLLLAKSAPLGVFLRYLVCGPLLLATSAPRGVSSLLHLLSDFCPMPFTTITALFGCRRVPLIDPATCLISFDPMNTINSPH